MRLNGAGRSRLRILLPLAAALLLPACAAPDPGTDAATQPPAAQPVATDVQALDSATCKVLAGLLKAVDRSLAMTAAGRPERSPADGVATRAAQAFEFAERFSKIPLPENIKAALQALKDVTTNPPNELAPALREHGLVLQHAMPQLCPNIRIHDLARHQP